MDKYQFYLKCLEMFEDVYNEHGAITDQQWFSLINRVMDCVYEEIKSNIKQEDDLK